MQRNVHPMRSFKPDGWRHALLCYSATYLSFVCFGPNCVRLLFATTKRIETREELSTFGGNLWTLLRSTF